MGPRATQSDRISQAQSMVSVQADCTMDEALALMKDRAMSTHSTLVEIADLVVDRLIRLGK